MAETQLNADEQRLAELGYKQELNRTWSGFSNFAISFSIISILAGCFTTFYQAWNNGGPVAISIGWPLISCFILIIGFCMSELVSAFPTAGGIYWWSATLGGARAGFYTGWLNLVGLIAILASVCYGCAAFFHAALVGHYWTEYATWFDGNARVQVFALFCVVLAGVVVFNIFSGHLMAVMNNISVWWHVIGAAVIVLILVFLPDDHQSASWVFTERINNSGFFDGGTGGLSFWFFILPLGFLLTQYTITGFDASAHVSEETQAAADSAAKGIWRSIFYSAIGGWIVLLALLFAVQPDGGQEAVNEGGGQVFALLDQALDANVVGLVLLICSIGQFFCSTSCATSCSRMLFAFSRDGAVPGSRMWSRVNAKRVPANAMLVSGLFAFLLVVPAVWNTVAFLAVVSIGVIGLYLAFAIPIWLRLRAGDSFQTGPWTLGSKYRWMCWVSVIEIIIVSVYFMLPFAPGGIPGDEGFTWTLVNYTPLVTFGVLIAITIWWQASARNWFTGPKRTVDLPPGVSSADELKLEAHGQTAHTDSA